MSSRTILSRPRTKVYNANYDIGESYYKSALDRLDRKYSGKPLSPPRQSPSLPKDLVERHEQAFADDDLPSARRRAEKAITEDNLFDARLGRINAGRPLSTSFEVEDEFDEEIANTLRKVRERRKAAKLINDVDMESTVNNISFHRMIDRTEKMLDTVGLNEKSARRILDEEPMSRRRVLRIASSEENGESNDMTKWTALNTKDDETSAAVRARRSRARLNDLEDEMEALSERQAARERRAASLRAIVAENAEETQAIQTAMKSTRLNMRSVAEKKSVAF